LNSKPKVQPFLVIDRGAVQAVGAFLLIRFAVALALMGKARGLAFFDVFFKLDVLGCLAFMLSDKEG